jgi:hypothetical protein
MSEEFKNAEWIVVSSPHASIKSEKKELTFTHSASLPLPSSNNLRYFFPKAEHIGLCKVTKEASQSKPLIRDMPIAPVL